MSDSNVSTLPLLPLRRGVLLPGTVTPIPVGRRRSRALAESLKKGDLFVLAVQFDAGVEDPAVADLHPVAVTACVHDTRLQGSRNALIVAESLERVRVTAVGHRDGHAEATIEPVEETNETTEEAEALARSLRKLVAEKVDDDKAQQMLDETIRPGLLADRVVGLVDVPAPRKAEVLHALDVEVRLRLAARLFHEARAQVELQESVTIFTALASLLTGRRVNPDVAMTGEATLRGRVLPVGGIKSKVLAAHRAGFSRVVIPKRNERDLEDIPEAVRDDVEFILAADMKDVLAIALEPASDPLTGGPVLGGGGARPGNDIAAA